MDATRLAPASEATATARAHSTLHNAQCIKHLALSSIQHDASSTTHHARQFCLGDVPHDSRPTRDTDQRRRLAPFSHPASLGGRRPPTRYGTGSAGFSGLDYGCELLQNPATSSLTTGYPISGRYRLNPVHTSREVEPRGSIESLDFTALDVHFGVVFHCPARV